jgi:hypothetical protein
MAESKSKAKGRKIGRGSRSPSHKNYLAQGREALNAAKRQRKHAKRCKKAEEKAKGRGLTARQLNRRLTEL